MWNKFIGVMAALLLWAPLAWAGVDAEYHFDSRGFNTLTVNGSTDLGKGWDLWGFIDLDSAITSDSNRFDPDSYFIEVELGKELIKDVRLAAQVNDANGSSNAVARLGLTYALTVPKLNTELTLWGFPIESDFDGGQIGFGWKQAIPSVLDGRLSFSGFFDLDVVDSEAIIVAENLTAYRINENLDAISELRYNENLSGENEFGITGGLRWRF